MIPAPAGRLRRALTPAALFAACSLPSIAVAQVSPQTLPPTREEVTRPQDDHPLDRPLQLEVEGELERAPCALDSPEFKDVRFVLRGVAFDGLQGLAASDLAGSYAQVVGTDQPISVICDIRDRAAGVLRNAGYIAAVQVPEQRLSDGVVQLQVIMARLTEVRVRGNATGAERIIAGYLSRLTSQPLFNRNEAERYLLLASDLAGYTVRLTLRPAGTRPGEVLGDVTVQRTPVYADLNIQNGGTKDLGRWGGFLRTLIFGLTGNADRTTFGLYTTPDFEEQRTIQLGHDLSIGGEGLRAGANVTYALAKPSIDGGDELEARTLLATVQAEYPFVRRLDRTLRGAFGMDVVNQEVEFGSSMIARDRLRVGFMRLGLDTASVGRVGATSLGEPRWRAGGVVELRKGLGIFGATDECLLDCGSQIPPSRPAGDATAASVRAQAYGEFHPLPMLAFVVRGRAQYASKPLPGFEQFAAGNYTVGRGYDPGSLLGDRGWGAQAEVRVGRPVASSPAKVAAEGYAFFDHARVRNLGPEPIGANRLSSAGVGARVAFDRFVFDTALAVPLSAIGGRKPDPRLLVSLTTRLWPWSYD